MKPIKFYGESKTGTTYLQKLLELNVEAEVYAGGVRQPLGWKHGFPQSGDAFYIFIFRDIYEWAKSLVVSRKDKRFNGLKQAFGGTEEYFWGTWNNPVECRIAKYYSYIGFGELHDCLFVSYDYLRGNPAPLMQALEAKGYDVSADIKDIEKHMYYKSKGRDNPDRRDLRQGELDFIDREKDPILEQWVDKLRIYG